MNSGTSSGTPAYYAIRIKGHLDPCWSDWLGGLTITPASPGRDETRLFGHVADQAALHGILNQIGSLGLTLIAVDCVDGRAEPVGADEPGSSDTDTAAARQDGCE